MNKKGFDSLKIQDIDTSAGDPMITTAVLGISSLLQKRMMLAKNFKLKSTKVLLELEKRWYLEKLSRKKFLIDFVLKQASLNKYFTDRKIFGLSYIC